MTEPLKKRYNEEDMKKALKYWTHDECKMLDSRLLNNKSPTTIFLVQTDSVSFFAPLKHYYIEFDHLQWHPGAPTNPIFESVANQKVPEEGNLIGIYEACDVCSKEFMRINFKSDNSFNILINNCQIQFGEISQTVVSVIAIGSLLTLVFLRSWLIILFLFIAVISILFAKKKKALHYDKCIHIR